MSRAVRGKPIDLLDDLGAYTEPLRDDFNSGDELVVLFFFEKNDPILPSPSSEYKIVPAA